MVITHCFQDLFDTSFHTSSLTLPSSRNNSLNIVFENEGSELIFEGSPPVLPFAQSNVFNAQISSWRRLTEKNEDCKAVYEVSFDVEGSNFPFSPGDTIGIIPKNKSEEVDFIITHLGLDEKADLGYILSLDKGVKGAKIPPYLPIKGTLREVLTNCVEIRAILKKLFILSLSKYTKDDKERKTLEYLCSKEGSEMYNSHVLNKRLCLLDLFSIFKTCKPPIAVVLTHLPRLLPRPYSIANSNLKDPKVLKVCFSVMKDGNKRKGLTTGQIEDVLIKELKDLETGDISLENGLKGLILENRNSTKNATIFPIYLRQNISGFVMPNVETPLLLLGPGTGVAPFIGFLEQKELIMAKDHTAKVGCSKLYFGCRNPKLDFIYEKELNHFKDKGVLNKLRTTFSRVDNDGVKYIQNALIQDGLEIVQFIENGASLFVCGDVKYMAEQIKETLVNCFVQYGDKTHDEAEKYVCNLQKNKRYIVDVWS